LDELELTKRVLSRFQCAIQCSEKSWVYSPHLNGPNPPVAPPAHATTTHNVP